MDSPETLSYTTCSIDMHFAKADLVSSVQLLLSVKGPITAKRGCRACGVELDAAETGFVHYREEWDADEAFHRHLQSEEFRRVLFAIDLCCEEPQIVVGKVSGYRGMPYLRKLCEEEHR